MTEKPDSELMGRVWDYIADGFPPARGRGIAMHSHTCAECGCDFECDCPSYDGGPGEPNETWLCEWCESLGQEGHHRDEEEGIQ